MLFFLVTHVDFLVYCSIHLLGTLGTSPMTKRPLVHIKRIINHDKGQFAYRYNVIFLAQFYVIIRLKLIGIDEDPLNRDNFRGEIYPMGYF